VGEKIAKREGKNLRAERVQVEKNASADCTLRQLTKGKHRKDKGKRRGLQRGWEEAARKKRVLKSNGSLRGYGQKR